jgi:hypothetical protein
MNNHLIPPFMMRLAGLEVNECAKFLAKEPKISHHSVYFPKEEQRIPFQLIGITSYIPTRTPNSDEMDNCQSLELTPQVSKWDPHAQSYQDQEDSMMDYRGNVREVFIKESHLI